MPLFSRTGKNEELAYKNIYPADGWWETIHTIRRLERLFGEVYFIVRSVKLFLEFVEVLGSIVAALRKRG